MLGSNPWPSSQCSFEAPGELWDWKIIYMEILIHWISFPFQHVKCKISTRKFGKEGTLAFFGCLPCARCCRGWPSVGHLLCPPTAQGGRTQVAEITYSWPRTWQGSWTPNPLAVLTWKKASSRAPGYLRVTHSCGMQGLFWPYPCHHAHTCAYHFPLSTSCPQLCPRGQKIWAIKVSEPNSLFYTPQPLHSIFQFFAMFLPLRSPPSTWGTPTYLCRPLGIFFPVQSFLILPKPRSVVPSFGRLAVV